MNEAWIQNLKAGDVVYVNSGNSLRAMPSRAKVLRLTATQIVVSSGKNLSGEDIEERFRKDDGGQVGGSTWSRSYLLEATPELVEQVRLYNLRQRVIKALGSVVVPKDRVNLEALYAAIQPYLPVLFPETPQTRVEKISEESTGVLIRPCDMVGKIERCGQ